MNRLAILLADVVVGPDGKITGSGGFAPASTDIGSIVQKGVNIFAFIIGIISVIMILVGALRYVLSAGNPQSTKEAKDTILYAVIGLIVAILSFAIVNFVITSIK